jgi:hypothetical protein
MSLDISSGSDEVNKSKQKNSTVKLDFITINAYVTGM